MTNKQIKNIVSEYMDLDISSKCRQTDYVYGRAIYFKMCYRHSTEILTFKNVADEVNRHHATTIHGINTYNDLFDTSLYFRDLSNIIEGLILDNTTEKVKELFKSIETDTTPRLKRKVKNLNIKIRDLQNKIYLLEKRTLKERTDKKKEHPIFEYLKKLRPDQLDYFYEKTIKDLAESK